MEDSNGSVVTNMDGYSEREMTRHLIKLKTDALFAYLKAIQDLNNKLREMNIEDEIQKIIRNFDQSCADVFLREGK
jgi:hypothetical protein